MFSRSRRKINKSKQATTATRLQHFVIGCFMFSDEAVQAIKALDAAGAIAFICCESGPNSPPQVVAKFRHIQDAQAYHRALIQCGEAARMIEAEEQADSSR
jgi:hypothetical protein